MPRQNNHHILSFARRDAPMCGGKRRYATKKEAEHVKDEQEIINPEIELKIYKCIGGCAGWHLTRASSVPTIDSLL